MSGSVLQPKFNIICHICEGYINYSGNILHDVDSQSVRVIAREMIIYLFDRSGCSNVHSPVSCHAENDTITSWPAIKCSWYGSSGLDGPVNILVICLNKIV